MATDVNKNVSDIKEAQDKLVDPRGKLSRFSYTEEAYASNEAFGVSSYNYTQEQNVPLATTEALETNATTINKGFREQASSISRQLMNHFLGRTSYNLNKINDYFNSLIVQFLRHLSQDDNAYSATAVYVPDDICFILDASHNKRTFRYVGTVAGSGHAPLKDNGEIDTAYWNEINVSTVNGKTGKVTLTGADVSISRDNTTKISKVLGNISGSPNSANGTVKLDSSGRIPYRQLPESAITLMGDWNASSNTPTLRDGTGTLGEMYLVSVAGTWNGIEFTVNDRIIYNGSIWRKMEGGSVNSVNDVSPVGGNVTLTGADVSISRNNTTKISRVLGNISGSPNSANGTVKLDSSGRIPYRQLPESAITLMGDWNAETNAPPLSDGMEGATSGDFYIVSVAGLHDFGSGEVAFLVNDRVIYNKENKWEKLAGGNVRSVNGKEPDNATGNITLYGTDIHTSETERINIIEKIKQYVGATLLGRYWAQSNKTNGDFNGGARYANGIWVACGTKNGGLWYSTDGKNWTQSNKINGYFDGGARYANGIWVACGSNSIGLWYSTDGKNWTQSNNTDGLFGGGARYTNGIWVACSNGTGLWYSTDGKNWTQSNNTNGLFGGGARYTNGIWVACANGAGLWYSTDGKNWTQSNKIAGQFYGGARYANGIWVACGNNNIGLWYSTDGKNWAQSNKTNGDFNGGARYANGIWVACGTKNGGLWYSTDGKNWTQSNNTDGDFGGGARYANGIWVACESNVNGLWYSTDGKNWTQSNKIDGYFNGGARYANGIWVACESNNGLWYSDVQTLIGNGWLK